MRPAVQQNVTFADLKNTAKKLHKNGSVVRQFHDSLRYSLQVAFRPAIDGQREQLLIKPAKRKRAQHDEGESENETTSPANGQQPQRLADTGNAPAVVSSPSSDAEQPTRMPRAVYEARTQWKKAHRVYMKALEKGGAFFLAFLLCISPRACKGTKTVERLLDEEASSFQALELDLGMANLFQKWADADGYSTNTHFANFLVAVFTKEILQEALDASHDTSTTPQATSTTPNSDVETVERIIRDRGLDKSETFVVMSMLFPDYAKEVDTEDGNINDRNLDKDTAGWEHPMEGYQFSELPIEKIDLVGGLIAWAIKGSRSWKNERRRKETISNCFTALVRMKTLDSGVCIVGGRDRVDAMIDVLDLRMKNPIQVFKSA